MGHAVIVACRIGVFGVNLVRLIFSQSAPIEDDPETAKVDSFQDNFVGDDPDAMLFQIETEF